MSNNQETTDIQESKQKPVWVGPNMLGAVGVVSLLGGIVAGLVQVEDWLVGPCGSVFQPIFFYDPIVQAYCNAAVAKQNNTVVFLVIVGVAAIVLAVIWKAHRQKDAGVEANPGHLLTRESFREWMTS